MSKFQFILPLLTLDFVLNSATMTIEELNNWNVGDFVLKLGKIFENSQWVAEAAYGEKPFQNVDTLFNTMFRVIMNAEREKQLELIRAHPELAGQNMISGKLTQHSTNEQTNAGLNVLTSQQLAEFNSLNSAFKARFNFPFILALRDYEQGGIDAILAAFRRRINNTEEEEINEALSQIGRIARHRLDDAFNDHCLDS